VKANRNPQAEDQIRAEAPKGAHPPRRILLVDDDALARRMNSELLHGHGYEVDVVEDGAAAWDTLRNQTYDLMVTDNNMPKLSGIELVKKVRAARMALPIILVSGMMPTEELKQHPLLHIDATLAKPFAIAQLLEKIEDVLSERKVIPFPMFGESRNRNRFAATTLERTASEDSWPDDYPRLFSHYEKPKIHRNWR
jgi:DNA-binding response OmpR family regulator